MKLFHIAVLAGMLAASILSGAGPSGVVIRAYNYAGLDDRIVRAAQRQTTSILSEAGTGAVWLHCPVSAEQSGRMSGCANPLAALDVVLKLLPRAMARDAGQTADTFGFAVPTSPTGLGIAYVFTDRTDELSFHGPFSTSPDITRPLVLGHVIAHELGHLLLGPKNHSSNGIMSPRWTVAEVRRIGTANLFFTTREAAAIRKRIAASTDASKRGGLEYPRVAVLNPGTVAMSRSQGE